MVLNTEMPLTEVEAITLEEATVTHSLWQSEWKLWFEARKYRLRASQLALVAKQKKDVNLKFLTSLLGEKASIHSPAISSGISSMILFV